MYCTSKSYNYLHFVGYNYAVLSGATASQSKTSSTRAASNAIDGDLTTRSLATNSYNVLNNYWWKVDIGERIIFTNTSIYVRDGKCGSTGALFDCCKYLYLAFYLSFLETNFDSCFF